MTANLTYIQRAEEALTAALEKHCPDAEVDSRLFDAYLLLVLAAGPATTLEQVHDAWVIWRTLTRPDHRSIVPFDQLSTAVQELDRPFVTAIVAASNALASAERA